MYVLFMCVWYVSHVDRIVGAMFVSHKVYTKRKSFCCPIIDIWYTHKTHYQMASAIRMHKPNACDHFNRNITNIFQSTCVPQAPSARWLNRWQTGVEGQCRLLLMEAVSHLHMTTNLPTTTQKLHQHSKYLYTRSRSARIAPHDIAATVALFVVAALPPRAHKHRQCVRLHAHTQR